VLPSVLFDRIRDRLDLANSDYLADGELGTACEEAYFDLWDFLIDRLGDEGPWDRQNLVTVPNQDFVDMPVASSVYRLLRLEFPSPGSNHYQPVRALNLASDDVSTQSVSFQSASSFRYFARRAPRAALTARQVAGGFAAWRFYFSPIPSAAYTLRVYYVPPPPIAFNSGTGDYTSFPDDFPEYVVADVCAKMQDKQEGDSAPFVAERERIKSRIERYAKPHQMNGPRRIANMRRLDSISGESEMDAWRNRR
jgi:hypothetical protein